MNKFFNYSPNFDLKKRKSRQIKFLIFHYTGMKKEKESINRLTSVKSKVSSHYLIKYNGDVLILVPDLFIAWHAGKSCWKNFKSLNKSSIGIVNGYAGEMMGKLFVEKYFPKASSVYFTKLKAIKFSFFF